jgi:hypothetical protein
MCDALQTLRDGLRQAAVHSPSPAMRLLAEAALERWSPVQLEAVATVDGCPYADRLRTLIADYHTEAVQ